MCRKKLLSASQHWIRAFVVVVLKFIRTRLENVNRLKAFFHVNAINKMCLISLRARLLWMDETCRIAASCFCAFVCVCICICVCNNMCVCVCVPLCPMPMCLSRTKTTKKSSRVRKIVRFDNYISPAIISKWNARVIFISSMGGSCCWKGSSSNDDVDIDINNNAKQTAHCNYFGVYLQSASWLDGWLADCLVRWNLTKRYRFSAFNTGQL